MSWILGSELDVKQCVEEKDTYLKKSKFLSEFKTKLEKRKALANLGIDSFTSWGLIDGFIENQKDLWNKLTELFKKIEKVDQESSEDIENLELEIEDLKKEIQELDDTKINKELDGDTATTLIAYTNKEYPTILSLKDALDELLYFDLEVTFSCSPSIAEQGSTVDSITYTWSYNKLNIDSIIFDGEEIDSTITTKIVDGPFTDNISKTLIISDGTTTIEKTASLYFYPGIYYGVGSELNMSSFDYKLLDSLNTSITVNATDDSNIYIWICTPVSYGTPTFTVNGFEGGFTLIDDNYQYNKYGTSVSYLIWRSDNGGLGSTTIIIS